MVKFHITRIRQQGAEWYDPQTDIKKILPDVVELVTSMMEELEIDKGKRARLARLHECLRILFVRISEDNTPLDIQLEEFLKALNECPADILIDWYAQVFTALLCVFALFSRRDSVTDKEDYITMLEYTRLSALRDSLPDGVLGEIKQKYGLGRGSVFTPLVQSRVVQGGVAVTEDGHILEGLKKIACRYMSCSGAEGWNELAAACDESFMDGKEKTDMEKIALGLSYPTYRYPTMQLEVQQDDGSKNEAKQTEDQGGPGSV